MEITLGGCITNVSEYDKMQLNGQAVKQLV